MSRGRRERNEHIHSDLGRRSRVAPFRESRSRQLWQRYDAYVKREEIRKNSLAEKGLFSLSEAFLERTIRSVGCLQKRKRKWMKYAARAR